MGGLKTVKNYIWVRFLQRNGVLEQTASEYRRKALALRAPAGRRPERITEADPDADTFSYRNSEGTTSADALQREAAIVAEDRSRQEMEIRLWNEAKEEVEKKRFKLYDATPDYHKLKAQANLNLSVVASTVVGEVGYLFFLFLEMFGADAFHLGRTYQKNHALVISCLFATTSFFVLTFLIAKQSLKPSRWRALPIIGLALISLSVGYLRMTQVSDPNATGFSTWMMAIFFVSVTFGLPFVTAHFVGKWGEAADMTSRVDSEMKRLDEEREGCKKMVHEAEKARRLAVEREEEIFEKFSMAYKEDKERREKLEEYWELHDRMVEAELAQIKTFYEFGQTGNKNHSMPAKRVKQIAAAILVAAAVFSGYSSAQAGGGFNTVVLCGNACTPEKVQGAARQWLDGADDAGTGRFEAYRIGKDFSSTESIYAVTYPEDWKAPVSASKRHWRENFFRLLAEKNARSPATENPAIAEAIYKSTLTAREGSSTVYIFSDMMEGHLFRFKKCIPSLKKFFDRLEANAVKPRFNGSTKVTVCGLGNAPGISPLTYSRLSSLWQAAFVKWGAHKANFSQGCDLGEG